MYKMIEKTFETKNRINEIPLKSVNAKILTSLNDP